MRLAATRRAAAAVRRPPAADHHPAGGAWGNGGAAAPKDRRHAIFAEWVAKELLRLPVESRDCCPNSDRDPAQHCTGESDEDAEGGGHAARAVVLDIAGGKGHLSAALREHQLEALLVDPCALSGRSSTMEAGTFAERAARSQPELKPNLCAVEPEPEPEPEPRLDPAPVRALTLQALVAAEPELVSSCAAIVGLHPDEATECLVDVALAHGRPFAVVPCCVMPHLFPERRLASSGAVVRKLGAFVEYLREKDPRIRVTTLPFQGRNTLLYMTLADYSLPRRPASPPPDYNPCALAAKAGDLQLLQDLRRRGHPWNTEVQQCGAWAGHLHVLRWARENGCPWCWEVCEVAARRGGHTEIVDWVLASHDNDSASEGGG
jgi:hypothetical protein